VLTERARVIDKTRYSVDDNLDGFRLKIDKRDAGGQFLNSEDNVEIIQAKTKFLLTGKKVNGVFLNGEFLSADRSVIKGSKDSYTIGAFNTWGYTKQKEKVRKAVLKADIFRLINSKTIQHAAGYEAKQMSGVGKLEEKLEKDIAKNKVAGTEDDWVKILLGNNEKKRAELPDSVKVKAADKVIREELHKDKKSIKNIGKKTTRIGKAFAVIKDDQRTVMDLCIYLLSDDTHPLFWDMAKEICLNHMPYKFKLFNFDGDDHSFTKYLSTNEQKDKATFKRALEYGRAEKGQLMRVALIDELNQKRKSFDITDIFGSMMPTRWKQYTEDLSAERGVKAILKQKGISGTFSNFLGDVFDGATMIGSDMKIFSGDVKDRMMVANIYMAAVTSVVNVGAITQVGAFGIGELYGSEKIDGVKTSDQRRWTTSLVFSMIRNLATLVKAMTKWKNKRQDEIKARQKKDPDYNPQVDLKFTRNKYYEIVCNLMSLAAGMGAECARYVNNTAAKDVCSFIKHTLASLENTIGAVQAQMQNGRIGEAEKDFETLMTREHKSKEDKQMIKVLKDNSQLQYGMSLAKRKSKDERNTKIFKTVKSAGKAGLSLAKVVVPGKMSKLFPPFVIIDSAWTLGTTIFETGMEIHQHKQNVKFNVGKMLGEKYKGVNKTVLSKVLKRETGIVSADYLPDLARIFMSINTHVFMQNASTNAEKKVGSKIAKTLLNNDKYTPDKLNKVKFKDLMTAMGVNGNFHKIIKHSLA